MCSCPLSLPPSRPLTAHSFPLYVAYDFVLLRFRHSPRALWLVSEEECGLPLPSAKARGLCKETRAQIQVRILNYEVPSPQHFEGSTHPAESLSPQACRQPPSPAPPTFPEGQAQGPF